MTRQIRICWVVLTSISMCAVGCHPQQPRYLFSDHDMSHYLNVATEIEYPDVDEPTLDEVKGSHAPHTLKDPQTQEMWDLTLQEAVRISLENGKVLRELGARLINDPLLDNPAVVGTVYDPSIIETGQGTSTAGTGVEAALSEFDAQLESNLFYEKVDQPQNSNVTNVFPPTRVEDRVAFDLGISKTTASGGRFSVTNATVFTDSNGPRATPQDYSLEFGLNFRQPLLQGRGVQFNRTVGPNSGHDAFFGFNGVAIARIRHDVSLADFEGKVHNFVRSVEEAYWDLLFAYHDLESQKTGRESALATWKKVHAKFQAGTLEGDAASEAQAREQYFLFQSRVEQSLTTLYRAESELRFLMGLSQSDGRLIRPADEPTTAKVAFDWNDIMCESLVRSIPLRQRKWEIKRRELELAGAKNFLLPRLDVVGNYNFLGLGEKLVRQDRVPDSGNFAGTYAYQDLTSGDHQEYGIGLNFSMPIGFRRELAGVRHYELQLARERALLEEQELSLSHELADALRELENQYALAETNFNRLIAAQRQVEAVFAKYEAGAGNVTLDLLLDAQRRRSEAETEYYRSLAEYNVAISLVHYRKGSLLEYNNVLLAEGPWPQKAYFDAQQQARKRDASMYLDYGFTRPGVFSRGPYDQFGGAHAVEGELIEGEVIQGEVIEPGTIENYTEQDELPAPMPTPDRSTSTTTPADAKNVATTQNKSDAFDWGELNLKSPAKSQVRTASHGE